METQDCIVTRRSTRDFLDKKISDEQIQTLINVGRHAPFGGPLKETSQLWEFIVVRDKRIKQKLAFDYDDRQFLVKAAVVIAVCIDTEKDPKYKDGRLTASLATQNILLCAHDMGLGACYITAFGRHEGHKSEKEKLRSTLRLPDHIELVCLIAIGHGNPDEERKEKPLRPVSDMIHKEVFSQT